MSQKRIAVFDYRVTATNPIGGCHLRMLRGLCHTYQFTVFAVEFENPCPERIRWVRIPVPVRPYVLLYLCFHIAAPLAYAWQYLRHGARFDLIQIVESNLLFGDVSYSQFCHRMYLRRYWSQSKGKGVRGFLRGVAHRVAAAMEPLVYRRVRKVVVPSTGLSRELACEYPVATSKLLVLPNPVDVGSLEPPEDAARRTIRTSLGLGADEVVLVFAALGHFERKGLPLVLEAMSALANPRLKLLVVGGEAGLVREYQRRVRGMNLEDRVQFEGMKRDLRSYYWAADAFVFPSWYETFSLVTFEAAAAGLPVLVTPLHGVEEMVSDRQNGFLVERTAEGVAAGIRCLLSMTGEQRRAMGERARQSVLRYSNDQFVNAWSGFYERLA